MIAGESYVVPCLPLLSEHRLIPLSEIITRDGTGIHFDCNLHSRLYDQFDRYTRMTAEASLFLPLTYSFHATSDSVLLTREIYDHHYSLISFVLSFK